MIYVVGLNVPELASLLVLAARSHVSPVWSAAVFVANTVLVLTLQAPTVLLSRFPRHAVLAFSGVVPAASCLGFLVAASLGGSGAAPAVAA